LNIPLIAGQLGVEEAVIRAVVQVEAAGNGRLPDGRPKVLFEAHHFDRLTGGKWRAEYPNLSSPKWNRALYARDQAGEWQRLNAAKLLDERAALCSASWGTFQIMGFNYGSCGVRSIDAFAIAMLKGDDTEGPLVVEFLRNDKGGKTLAALKAKDWPTFAALYNGPAYKQNDYDGKLARAYAEFAKGTK
jgi:hypothetical protein